MKRYLCAMLLTVGVLTWIWHTLEYAYTDWLEGSIPLINMSMEG